MRSLLFASSLFLVLAGCQAHEMPKPPSSQPQEAAANALGVLQKLVNAENYKAMGFDSIDEVKQARLGQPMSVFNVPLDQLKGFKPTGDANALLAKSAETIYPVTVDGQVKSSVTIVQSEGGYRPASFGNAPIIKSLSKYRQGENAANDFVVRVPALNLYFLGSRVADRLMLTPIVSDPRLKLQPGEPLPAETVLEQVVPLANSYNGLPM